MKDKLIFYAANKMYRITLKVAQRISNIEWFFMRMRERHCDCEICKEHGRGIYARTNEAVRRDVNRLTKGGAQ